MIEEELGNGERCHLISPRSLQSWVYVELAVNDVGDNHSESGHIFMQKIFRYLLLNLIIITLALQPHYLTADVCGAVS